VVTKVPVITIEEDAEPLKLWCEWCDVCETPHREFLSEYRDCRYEGASCPRCGKQIAGLVVKLSHRRRQSDKRG
jgi:hypothetical protein